MNNNYLFTSESVTEGHPDKIADAIADAVLDEVLKQDKYGRVACEVALGMGYVIVGGEITTSAQLDVNNLVRKVIKDIGYDQPEYGFDYHTVAVLSAIHGQSPDIARGVRKTSTKKQGAGDQGFTSGFACRETKELMPLPIILAHKLVRKLTEVRKKNVLSYLRPDGKSQVTLEYKDGKNPFLTTVIIAAQHDPDVKISKLRKDIKDKVIRPVCKDYLSSKTKFYINNTGRFVIGGPVADCGQTNRKIVVDSYGGTVSSGGGGLSGKDPTKIDRSGAYMARYIAKNIVAAKLAEKCQVRLAYMIGGTKPTELSVNTFGTGKVPENRLLKIIPKVFDLSPGGIIKQLKLLRPIYQKTSCYGHFGRGESCFTWEKKDQVKKLLKGV